MNNNGARPREKRKSNGNVKNQHKETDSSTEQDSNRFYQHLSIRLYDILDRVGASEDHRKLRQDCVISREIINTISTLTPRTGSQFIFGSSSEGTTTLGLDSDTDFLNCSRIPAVENIKDAGDGQALLMFRDKHTQPGYVKLQRVYNGLPQTVYMREINPDQEEFDSEGRICLKQWSFVGKVGLFDARNGPADTNTHLNADFVGGYRCSTIPEFATEWIRRDRQYKWPSKRMLDKMSTMGCFVVGVGHPTSTERDIEWRLSFSLQERALMFSMNIVQHKCYILLKVIKKDLIDPKVGELISSYHLKTCMFYVIANTPLSFWKRENLIQCVMVCLYVLLKWVYTGYCPNYFIKEENMFDRDLHRTQRLTLLQHMHCLLNKGCGFFFLIKLDQVGVFLKNGVNSVQTEMNLSEVRFKEKRNFVNVVLLFRYFLCCQANAHDNARNFLNIILKYVSQTKSFIDYNKQQTEVAFSYIIPFIHLQLAQSYASLAFMSNTTEAQCFLLQESGHHLREGRHCDLTSALFLEATVFIKLEQYERCIGILDQFERVLKKNPLTLCNCYLRYYSYSSEHQIQLNNLPVSEILERTSTCMTFLRTDMSITPEALQHEMFRSIKTQSGSRHYIFDKWFDMAVVDAVVYLHFLQYLAHANLNRRIQKHVTINKLESVLKDEKKLGHLETGYNLLGWIHFHENWISQGIKYFQKSWSIRPHHNAAKLHVLKWIRDRNYQRSKVYQIMRCQN